MIDCKEQTMLESIKDGFDGEHMQALYNILG